MQWRITHIECLAASHLQSVPPCPGRTLRHYHTSTQGTAAPRSATANSPGTLSPQSNLAYGCTSTYGCTSGRDRLFKFFGPLPLNTPQYPSRPVATCHSSVAPGRRTSRHGRTLPGCGRTIRPTLSMSHVTWKTSEFWFRAILTWTFVGSGEPRWRSCDGEHASAVPVP